MDNFTKAVDKINAIKNEYYGLHQETTKQKHLKYVAKISPKKKNINENFKKFLL